MRIALDTNRYVDLIRGETNVVSALEKADAVLIPFVVIGELRAGFCAGTRRAENEEILERFLLKNGVEVLYPTDQTTRNYAGLFTQLRAQGTPIPTNDLWVAALVIEKGLTLMTRDRHFGHIPQLHLL